MANIRCGTLQKSTKEGFEFVGKLVYGSMAHGDIVMRKARRTAASGEGAPDYDVFFTPKGSDNTFHAGAAWLKNGNRVGDFLSLSLDSPDWPGAVNLAAFPPDGGDTSWTIVWSRPRGERVQEERAA